MAKVAITLEDKADDQGVDVRVEYDPPIDAKVEAEATQAQTLGYMLMTHIAYLSKQAANAG